MLCLICVSFVQMKIISIWWMKRWRNYLIFISENLYAEHAKNVCSEWVSEFCVIFMQHNTLKHITRMHSSAIRCVRSHDQSIWKKGKFDPPHKYKMDKDIQTPPRIYDYVTELSCCAKSEENRLTQFCWGNRGSLSFFTHTHTISQTNSFISPTDHKNGRIWNIYGSKRVVHAQMCFFGGSLSLMTNHV